MGAFDAEPISAFDAELYLRLAGERALLDKHERNGWPQDSALSAAARALIAIGAIAPARAQEVLDDYALAMALRSEGRAQHARLRAHRRSTPEADAQPLEPLRVASCEAAVELPTGTLRVRHVSLSESATKVATTLHRPPDARALGRSGAAMMVGRQRAQGPPEVTLEDDRGTTVTAHFRGGGSAGEWRGHLSASHPPLAKDTRWIEVEGQRIDLVDRPPGVEVSVETLADERPALRHLWQRAANPSRLTQRTGTLAPAIDALVAAGALSAEDPAIDDLRVVVASLHPGGRPSPGGHPGGGSSPGGARSLPEPWRSLLARRGAHAGPLGEIPIGAVTPLFDGISVAVLSLESSDESFALEVEASPGLSAGMPFDSDVQQRQLTWWAADNRGNHYLGQLGGWSGGDGHAEGQIEFSPALDPEARRLDIMPTADRARAVIRVALEWPKSTGEDR